LEERTEEGFDSKNGVAQDEDINIIVSHSVDNPMAIPM
jgi:hypothetical protein